MTKLTVKYNPETQSFTLPSGDEIAAELIWECLNVWHKYVETIPSRIEQTWKIVTEVRSLIKDLKSE